jgi:perosamine synthetase
LYGNAADIIKLREICNEFGLVLIEDSAEALGTYVHNRPVGTFGKFGVFSFHGSKTITCGEGGMLVTDDADLYEAVRRLNNHGRDISETRQFWASKVGYKYRMTDMQAAIGMGQISRFEELTSRKREILENYRKLFSNIPGISINPEVEGMINGAWMPNIVLEKSFQVDIERLREHMNTLDIDARVFFWPLSSMGIYGDPVKNPNAYELPKRSLNLPSFHDMTDEEQNRVYNAVKDFLEV